MPRMALIDGDRGHTRRTWFRVAFGEGVVEKALDGDGTTESRILGAAEGMAGRRASDGQRYRSIGAAMVD